MNQIKSEPLRTVLIITMGFLFIFWTTQWNWAFFLAMTVGMTGALSDYLAKKIEYAWMKLAHVLSFIVPNVLLTTIFFLILTPIAMLNRIFGEKDTMNLKNTKASMFKITNKQFDRKSFEKPW